MNKRNKHYETYNFIPENIEHLEQWLEEKLDCSNLKLVNHYYHFWIFENLDQALIEPTSGFYKDATASYAEFYDKMVIALGFSPESNPCTELDEMMLQKVYELMSYANN